MTEIDSLRDDGIAAIKSGQRTKGRALLREVVRQNPNDVTAWLWLSGAVEPDGERQECLERVLAIDPENPHAKKGLQALRPAPVAHQETIAPPSPAQAKASSAPKTSGTVPRKAHSLDGLLIGVAAIIVLLVVAGAAILVLWKSNQSADRNVSPSRVANFSERRSGKWNIIPLDVRLGAMSNGWQSVSIPVAVENGTSAFALPDFSEYEKGQLITQEGYSYDISLSRNFPWTGMYATARPQLPPGYRYRGTDVRDGSFYLAGRIAQNTHPVKIVFPSGSEVDLINLPLISFPGGESYGRPVRRVGDSWDASNVRLTFVKAEKEYSENGNEYVSVTLDIQNLDLGHEANLKFEGCTAIGADGIAGSWTAFEKSSGGLGPGQTQSRKLVVHIPNGAKNVVFVLCGDINEALETEY